MQQSAIRI